MHPSSSSRIALALGALLTLSVPALAGKIRVPKDAPTIADAIELAQPGDRIVVTRGQFVETLVIETPDIEIVTRRAKQHADVHVMADGVTIRGLKMEGGSVLVHEGAEGVTVERSRFRGGQVLAAGDDLTVDKNRFQNTRHMGAAEIYADDATVTRNKFKSSVCAVVVVGDEPTVADNRMNQADEAGVFAESDDAVIEDNRIRGVNQMDAITIEGDDALVVSNSVSGSVGGVRVDGDGATIDENSLHVGFGGVGDIGRTAGCPGVTVLTVEPGTQITGNTIVHNSGIGIHVEGTGVEIAGNHVAGVAAQDSIEVIGSDNTVAGNVIHHPIPVVIPSVTADQIAELELQGDAIEVLGDDNTVVDNYVASAGLMGIEVQGDRNDVRSNHVEDTVHDAVFVVGADNTIVDNDMDRAGHDGLVVAGDQNVLTGNDVVDAAGCGVMIQGSVDVTECTVRGCALGGLVNHSDDADVTNSTFQSNAPADVIDLGTFGVFSGNTFGTLTRDPNGLPPDVQTGTNQDDRSDLIRRMPPEPAPQPPGFPQFR